MLSRKTFLFKIKIPGSFLAFQVWHSYPYSPGSELVSAHLPWPIPRAAGAIACLHIPWMGSASQSAGAVQSRLVPMHLASPDKAVSLFLKPAEHWCWKGAPCFSLAQTSYFMHVPLLLQQSLSFSWDFKIPRICTGYLCRFPERNRFHVDPSS